MTLTTNIQSLTIMATVRIYNELILLLRSIYLFHPDIPIFILAQQAVCQKLAHEQQIPTNITLIPGMEEYSKQHWDELPIKQAIRFLDLKTYAMHHALKSHANTLFMDSDLILTAPLGLVDDTKDIGLSPRIYNSHIWGNYIAGWIFVSNKVFLNWWSHQVKVTNINSFFAEQFILDDAKTLFSFFLFPKTYNFAPTHSLFLVPGSRKHLHRALHFKSNPNRTLTYRNQTIISIHMHCLLFTGPRQVYPWGLLHLYKQFPFLFHKINHKSNRIIPHQVFQQDSLFFLFSFSFSQTLFRVYQIQWLSYIFSNRKNTPYKTIRRRWFRTIERGLWLFVWPYYLWCLKQEIVYLYHLLVHKKAMLTTKVFVSYTIQFIFLLLLSPITKKFTHRNRNT